MERNRRGRPRHPDVLTPAEWRVLEALREGGTNAEIAARLGLSPDTVKTHISNMLAKLELRDRRALAAWRPATPRHRLGGVLAVPAAVWSVGRPLAWVGVGAAALAGVAVVVVALVALEVLVEGDRDPPAAVAPPPVAPTPTPSPAPTVEPATTPATAPTASPTALPPPLATPIPTASPTPQASSRSGASALPSATPSPPRMFNYCVDALCIEEAPDAFEYKTWEPEWWIDWEWNAAAWILDTQTGWLHAYRVRQPGHDAVSYSVLSHGWVTAVTSSERLLLDRETMRAWRWPSRGAELVDVSPQHVLFELAAYGSYALLARNGGAIRTFEAPDGMGAFFSPDGQVMVASGSRDVYRIPIASLRPELLLRAEPPEGWEDARVFVVGDSGPVPTGVALPGWPSYLGGWAPPPGRLAVEVQYTRSGGEALEWGSALHLFDWDGAPLGKVDEPVCPSYGLRSPDGRHIASQEGTGIIRKRHGHGDELMDDPWSSVVIANAETCEPIFRVRSAFIQGDAWSGQWLADSGGIVVGLRTGFAVVRLDPQPHLIDLPAAPPAYPPHPLGSVGATGPVPAPTGGGRYFAYSFPGGVFDAHGGHWIQAPAADGDQPGPNISHLSYSFSWGETHEELWLTSFFWEGYPPEWLLLPPRIEFPPFNNDHSFRVARALSCLNLVETPEPGGDVLECLVNGTRLSLGAPSDPAGEEPYPYISGIWGVYSLRVRTDAGIEGWVSIDYLDHE